MRRDDARYLLLSAIILALAIACAPVAPARAPATAEPPAAPKAPAKAEAPATPKAPAKVEAPAAIASPTAAKPQPAAATPQAKVVSAADFYKDKTVTLVVPYGAGGGTDFGARTIASYWPEVAGGAMIVRNRPAGGGLEGMNAAYEAKPDGLTLGFGITGIIVSHQLFQEPGVKYDVSKINWIGDFGREKVGLSVSAQSPYRSMDDVRNASGLKFGALSPRAVGALGAALAIELFGLKDARVVPGYSSTAEVEVAMARGEMQGQTTQCATLREAAAKGFAKPPFVALDFERCEVYPETPAVPELIQLSPSQEKGLRIFVSMMDVSKVVYGPPGLPEDRVQFLREAFNKLMGMRPVQTQLKLRFQMEGGHRNGKDVTAEVQKLLAIPRQDIVSFDEMTNRHIK
ncbi:MAG: hypothetical protein HY675_18735 [Chloroflexi bacterium]|nr:hypothetical protein [Chloroflexota bacterium]